jgi:hypothetical protein
MFLTKKGVCKDSNISNQEDSVIILLLLVKKIHQIEKYAEISPKTSQHFLILIGF